MRALALFMMVSGWLIAVAACTMLHSAAVRLAFCCAALAVEVVGLAMLFHRYRAQTQQAGGQW